MTESAAFKVPAQIEQAIEETPAISPIFNKLAEMAGDMEVEPIELVKLIMIDPVLSGKVIKLVNSAYYGLTQQVTSLAQAVVMLGMNTVKNLAMYTAVLDKVFISQKGAPLDPKAFWYHCISTAVACKMLAKAQEVPPEELETYFLAGLLHDLGKVLFIKGEPEAYQKVLEDSKTRNIPLHMAEQERFGFTHNQIGGILARKWKLDSRMLEVIENHHQQQGAVAPENEFLMRVILANNLCKQAGLGQSGNSIVEDYSPLMKMLQVEPETLEEITGKLPTELEKAMKFLKIDGEMAST